MTRAERIALAIQRSGKKNGQIAAEIGISPSSVSQWRSGLTKSIRPENLAALARATAFGRFFAFWASQFLEISVPVHPPAHGGCGRPYRPNDARIVGVVVASWVSYL